MSIQKVFDQGKTGLAVSQKALSVTGHNISNVNTDGYSRQRVEQESLSPTDFGRARVGSGVKIETISRAHSSFINRRIEKEGNELSGVKARSGILSQIENIFVRDGEQGLSKAMSNFFNSVRSLTTEPSSMPMRTAVVEAAKNVASDFNRLDSSMEDVRVDLDNRVEGTVSKINGLTGRIASLNKTIMNIEGSMGIANDERDQRDRSLQELSKLVDIRVSEVDHGGVNVSSGQLGDLVSGVDSVEMHSVRRPTDNYPDAVTISLGTSTKGLRDVTRFVKGGELGAYLDVRDKSLAGVRSEVNMLANEFANNVNRINTSAYSATGERGNPVFEFDVGNNPAGAIKINDELKMRPNLLAGASEKGAIGDNRAFLELAALETNKVVGGEKTILDYNSELIGRIGIETRSALESVEAQQGIYSQLETLREEESGVSLDEEAMNMVKYQKAFDASAKVIQVADSMLETVINLKRF